MNVILTEFETKAINRASLAAYWSKGDDYILEDLFRFPGQNDMLHLIKAYEKLFILREFIKHQKLLTPVQL